MLLDWKDHVFYSMATLLDHKTTLAYLAYLGYPEEPRTDALQISRPCKADRRKGKTTRNVFLCYVCGAAGSGKTSLLRSFVGKPFTGIYEPTSKMISVVNAVDIDGSEKYLVVCMVLLLTRPSLLHYIIVSYKNLAQNLRLKHCETQRKLISQTSLSMYMILVIPTRSPTSAIYVWVVSCVWCYPGLLNILIHSNNTVSIIYQRYLLLLNQILILRYRQVDCLIFEKRTYGDYRDMKYNLTCIADAWVFKCLLP